MKIDKEKFLQAKKKAKIFYDNVEVVRCPFLKQEVRFNQEGFNHLLAKSWNRGRSFQEQYARLRLFPKVVEILKKCYTLQEYDERKMFIRQKVNSRWEKRLKKVVYYVFVALLLDEGIRFKIVIKHVEGGQPFFWSVYPSWKVEKKVRGSKTKIFYSGNLEHD